MRPFYLPRGVGNIILCAVCIPPGRNAKTAANEMAEVVHTLLQCTSLYYETLTCANLNRLYLAFTNILNVAQETTRFWTNVTVLLKVLIVLKLCLPPPTLTTQRFSSCPHKKMFLNPANLNIRLCCSGLRAVWRHSEATVCYAQTGIFSITWSLMGLLSQSLTT